MPRGNAHKPETRQAALEAFQGEESMKAIGKRLGVQYKNVRAWWEGEFGEEKIKARGKNLQAKRTRENAVKTKGKSRKVAQKDVECAVCGCTFQKSAISAAKTSRIVCSSCKDAERGGDTPCPVCGFLCNGKKGVGVHLRHQQNDPAHAEYLAQQAKPEGEEGINYVVCPFPGCDHTRKSMAGHFESVHNTTWAEVKLQYPDAKWAAKKSNDLRASKSVEIRKLRGGYEKGKKKEVVCPTCAQPLEVSLYAGPIHDLRCEECKAEDELIRWAGKKELVDYVVCKECGHHAEFLNSHVNSEHKSSEAYRKKHPGAPLTAVNAGQRKTPSNKIVLSVDDLKPFMNEEGAVLVSAVCSHVGCTPHVIRKICNGFGIPTQNRLALQKSVLDHAAKYLGEHYVWEHTDDRIRSPETGRLLRFDGFFSKRNLLIEVHGEQHDTFIPYWQKDPDNFKKRVEIDQWKEQEAKRLGFEFKTVRKEDAFTTEGFWKSLLGGDSLHWQNKDEGEKQELVEKVFKILRAEGFPKFESHMQAKAKFTSLCNKDMHLDKDRVVSPPFARVGSGPCASFFPNRHKAKHRSASMSAYEAWHNDQMLKTAIRGQLDHNAPTTAERVLRTLSLYVRTPSVFRPPTAKYVYRSYCPPGGVVWDPCSGFGGRLLGAMSAGVGKYLATDIEPETVEGNRKLSDFYGFGRRCEIHCHKAQDFKPSEELDLVFTSPPYFNLETYGDFSDQKEEYETVFKWVSGFLRPMMENGYQALRGGGYIVLNLPDKVLDGAHLPSEATRIARDLGMVVEPSIYMAFRTKKERRLDPLVVFRKP